MPAMSKISHIMAMLAVFASCSVRPEMVPSKSEKQKEPVLISARHVAELQGETRTTLSDDGATVLWTPGDAINIFFGNQSEKFVSTLTEGTSEMTSFQGELDQTEGTTYYGLYPYQDTASFKEGVITMGLPNTQEGVEGTFADDLFISVGRSSSTEMPFYNVCSGIRFSVDRDDISSLTFRANGSEPLAGSFKVGFDNETERPYIAEIIDGSSSITVSAPENQCFKKGTWYYLITLPVQLSKGFTIEIDGERVHASVRSGNTLSLNRSRFRKAALSSTVYDAIDLDIEATQVRNYLDNTDYSNDLTDYSRSYISNYTSGSSSGGSSGGGGGPGGGTSGGGSSSSSSREDYPAPVTFHWASAQERTLEYSTNADYSDATVVSVSASTTSTEIYNLIPGKTYYWRSVGSDGTLLNESTFVPVGPLRMIYSSTRNVRDMGGWKAGSFE